MGAWVEGGWVGEGWAVGGRVTGMGGMYGRSDKGGWTWGMFSSAETQQKRRCEHFWEHKSVGMTAGQPKQGYRHCPLNSRSSEATTETGLSQIAHKILEFSTSDTSRPDPTKLLVAFLEF